MSQPVAPGSATGALATGLPTVAGRIPAGMEASFQGVAAPAVPELTSLPRPGERCPFCGKSRTWMIEANEEAKRAGLGFMFRVRQRGRMRGAVFVRVSALLAWLRHCEAIDLGQPSQGGTGGHE